MVAAAVGWWRVACSGRWVVGCRSLVASSAFLPWAWLRVWAAGGVLGRLVVPLGCGLCVGCWWVGSGGRLVGSGLCLLVLRGVCRPWLFACGVGWVGHGRLAAAAWSCVAFLVGGWSPAVDLGLRPVWWVVPLLWVLGGGALRWSGCVGWLRLAGVIWHWLLAVSWWVLRCGLLAVGLLGAWMLGAGVGVGVYLCVSFVKLLLSVFVSDSVYCTKLNFMILFS